MIPWWVQSVVKATFSTLAKVLRSSLALSAYSFSICEVMVLRDGTVYSGSANPFPSTKLMGSMSCAIILVISAVVCPARLSSQRRCLIAKLAMDGWILTVCGCTVSVGCFAFICECIVVVDLWYDNLVSHNLHFTSLSFIFSKNPHMELLPCPAILLMLAACTSRVQQ